MAQQYQNICCVLLAMSTFRFIKLLFSLSLACLCVACASNQTIETVLHADDWKGVVISKYDKLAASHPDRIENILTLSQEMKDLVANQFNRGNKNKRINTLAKWMVSKQGHNLSYDVEADLTPIQAFKQRRGNCLTFSMLLISLAEEMDIKLDFNEVDIPNSWGVNKHNGYILYRHVNAYRNNGSFKQVFDLSMERYDFGYPQRLINKNQAIAKHHSNRAITLMRSKQLAEADDLLELALSLDPNSPDIWANYGVLLKQKKEFKKAEDSFLYALSLDSSHTVAATNLERYYKDRGISQLAEKYRAIAIKARKTNPYYQYQMAKLKLQQLEIKPALKHIKKALKLHNKDHRFYDLKGQIYVQLKRADLAAKSFYSANQLADNIDDKIRYANEINSLTSLLITE